MNDSSLITLLGLSPEGADFDDIGRLFIEHVKSHVKKGADCYDDHAVKQEEAYLRAVYAKFFTFTISWIRDELVRNKDSRNHAEAAALKNQAKGVLRDLQDNIVTFTLVSMAINRFMVLVRDEIRNADVRGVSYTGEQKILWTGDTGLMLARNKKRKAEIDILLTKYRSAVPLLEATENDLKFFHDGLSAIFSREDADKILGSLRSGLRTGDFTRARGAARSMTGFSPRFTVDKKSVEAAVAALGKKAETIILRLEENAERLASEDQKIFLGPSELRLIQDSLTMEARKIRSYIIKYNLPYMEYKLDHLTLLNDKLLVVGSLDSLMTLYLRLVSGMARPMVKLEDVRLYEGEVLGPIKFLQGGQFEEMQKILVAAVKTVDEFRQARQEYRNELEALSGDAEAVDMMQNVAEG